MTKLNIHSEPIDWLCPNPEAIAFDKDTVDFISKNALPSKRVEMLRELDKVIKTWRASILVKHPDLKSAKMRFVIYQPTFFPIQMTTPQGAVEISTQMDLICLFVVGFMELKDIDPHSTCMVGLMLDLNTRQIVKFSEMTFYENMPKPQRNKIN